MTTFDKREEALENKFFHEEDLRFKAMARRNRQLGLWAAEILGFSAEQADRYADGLLQSDIDGAGPQDVLHKILGDFEAAHVSIGEQTVRRTMTQLFDEALRDIRAGV